MNSRSMLRRLNRLFPPPDPEKLAQEAAREFFREFVKFVTHKEFQVLQDIWETMAETDMSLDQFAEKDPQRVERYVLALKAISDRRASGIKVPWEERLPPRVRGRSAALAARERADEEERRMK